MKANASKAQVILRHQDKYDPEQIQTIVSQGLKQMDIHPRGRTLLKPNIVVSGPGYENVHTRPEFTEGVLKALKDRGGDKIEELAVGERCGINFSSRFGFKRAGYNPMLKRVGAKRYCFDEEQQVEIPLSHQERLRDYVYTPSPVARADFFVNCPKFKMHELTTVTFSLKNYMGIQDDRHRMIDHNHLLSEKIADLQYIVQPEFIAMDAISACDASVFPSDPFPLNLVILGNNQVATDAVCCHIIGIDPLTVEHIRIASERGLGPTSLQNIRISGDIYLKEAQERAKDFRASDISLNEHYKSCNITCYMGHLAGSEKVNHCIGGCPRSFWGGVELLRHLHGDAVNEKMPRMHVIVGAYQGPIDAQPDEPVVFVGDCTAWKGKIGNEAIDIKSTFEEGSRRDPRTAKHKSPLHILARVRKSFKHLKKQGWAHMPGCPVFFVESAAFLGKLAGLDTHPPKGMVQSYLKTNANVAIKRLIGQPYQTSGPVERGHAKPEWDPLL